MKKLILSTLPFLFFLVFSSEGNAQWNQLTLNTTTDLLNISFPSNDTGYVISGKVYRTFNGGLSFDSVAVPTMAQYEAIHFRTNTDGVVCGGVSPSGQGVFRTINAGQTWLNISPTNVAGVLMNVQFADAMHGTLTTSGPEILNTANGGITWDTMTFLYDFFYAIDYPTATTGYIGGFDGTFNYRGIIRKTTNGGVTWTLATSFPNNNTNIQQIHFLNADTGFASYSPYMQPAHLLRTRDGAVTWDTILFNQGDIVQFAFSDYTNGFIVNDSGSIYRTNDAGVTWMLDRVHTNTLTDICVTPSYAYSTGNSGLIIKRNLTSGIPVQQYNTELKIYPNPGADHTTILLPHGTNVVSISAMDVTGRNCGNISFSQGNADEIILNTRALAKGNYVLEIITKAETLNVKFEKAN